MNMNKEEILKNGKIEVQVKRFGQLKREVFEVKYEKLLDKKYPILFLDKFIELNELCRIADEVGLPIKAKNGIAFPKGKTAMDFLV
ncbi:MAG: hypothetical protein ACP5HJ_00260 [Candidatus Micrarchaeia archaeon]|jgi:hypothetical protein